MRRHPFREAVQEGLRLNVEVSEHLVRPPAAEETDGVGVDLGAEECICASGAKATCRDVGWEEPKRRS